VLFATICPSAMVAVAPPWRIDRGNILQASLWAPRRSVEGLTVSPGHLFVDARDRFKLDCACEAVNGGDGLALSIAAASIIARVTQRPPDVRPGAGMSGLWF